MCEHSFSCTVWIKQARVMKRQSKPRMWLIVGLSYKQDPVQTHHSNTGLTTHITTWLMKCQSTRGSWPSHTLKQNQGQLARVPPAHTCEWQGQHFVKCLIMTVVSLLEMHLTGVAVSVALPGWHSPTCWHTNIFPSVQGKSPWVPEAWNTQLLTVRAVWVRQHLPPHSLVIYGQAMLCLFPFHIAIGSCALVSSLLDWANCSKHIRKQLLRVGRIRIKSA